MPKVDKREPKLIWKSGKILAAISPEGKSMAKPFHEFRDAQLLGPFAVMPCGTEGEEHLISLAHVPTGRTILKFRKIEDALEGAELLARTCLE